MTEVGSDEDIQNVGPDSKLTCGKPTQARCAYVIFLKETQSERGVTVC